MNKPDLCREEFLDGITDVVVSDLKGLNISVPWQVPQVLELTNVTIPSEPTLHIATSGGHFVVADSITAKSSVEMQGSLAVYTFDISANIIVGYDNVREICKNMRLKDHVVLLRKADGTYVLCYTLPSTFHISSTATMECDRSSRTITIKTKSLSDFITIQTS